MERPLLNALGATVGIIMGCGDSIGVWSSVQRLSLPRPPLPVTTVPPLVQPALSRRDRMLSRSSGILRKPYIFPIAIFIAIMSLTMLNSPVMIDIFWFSFVTYIWTPLFVNFIDSLLASGRTIKYGYTPSNDVLTLIFKNVESEYIAQKLTRFKRTFLAASSCVVLLGFEYNRINILRPIFLGLAVYCLLRVCNIPKLNTRSVVKALVIIEITIPLFFAILVGALYFALGPPPQRHSSPESSGKQPDERAYTSEVQISLMSISQQLLSVGVPAILIALNARFEHSLRLESTGIETPLNPAKVDEIEIPRSQAISYGMISEFSIISFFLSSLGASLCLGSTYNGQPCDVVVVFITIPAVLLSSVFAIWWTGNLAAWWRYEEIWIPKLVKGDIEETAVTSEVVRYTDEKTGLNGISPGEQS